MPTPPPPPPPLCCEIQKPRLLSGSYVRSGLWRYLLFEYSPTDQLLITHLYNCIPTTFSYGPISTALVKMIASRYWWVIKHCSWYNEYIWIMGHDLQLITIDFHMHIQICLPHKFRSTQNRFPLNLLGYLLAIHCWPRMRSIFCWGIINICRCLIPLPSPGTGRGTITR